jgi:hypothetical protein
MQSPVIIHIVDVCRHVVDIAVARAAESSQIPLGRREDQSRQIKAGALPSD